MKKQYKLSFRSSLPNIEFMKVKIDCWVFINDWEYGGKNYILDKYVRSGMFADVIWLRHKIFNESTTSFFIRL